MLYYYLAESFGELDNLAALVQQLADPEKPVEYFTERNYIAFEINRIKNAACRDILIFNAHQRDYVRLQLCKIYELLIIVHETLKHSPALVLQADYNYHRAVFGSQLIEGLTELEDFYTHLRVC